MTRLEFLQLVVARARANGFELRRWYTTRLGLPWINANAALTLLETQRRYYALLFSHEFASTFWAPGTDIIFELPSQSFSARMPDGTVRTIERKSHLRRSARRDVWKYHLKQMALAEEPLRYLRKYMRVEEQLDPEPEPTQKPARKRRQTSGNEGFAKPPARTAAKKRPARPLPTEPPAFLKRPYPGA